MCVGGGQFGLKEKIPFEKKILFVQILVLGISNFRSQYVGQPTKPKYKQQKSHDYVAEVAMDNVNKANHNTTCEYTKVV